MAGLLSGKTGLHFFSPYLYCINIRNCCIFIQNKRPPVKPLVLQTPPVRGACGGFQPPLVVVFFYK
jgi:hypothetical protein